MGAQLLYFFRINISKYIVEIHSQNRNLRLLGAVAHIRASHIANTHQASCGPGFTGKKVDHIFHSDTGYDTAFEFIGVAPARPAIFQREWNIAPQDIFDSKCEMGGGKMGIQRIRDRLRLIRNKKERENLWRRKCVRRAIFLNLDVEFRPPWIPTLFGRGSWVAVRSIRGRRTLKMDITFFVKN